MSHSFVKNHIHLIFEHQRTSQDHHEGSSATPLVLYGRYLP
jgi:hypothetical protein